MASDLSEFHLIAVLANMTCNCAVVRAFAFATLAHLGAGAVRAQASPNGDASSPRVAIELAGGDSATQPGSTQTAQKRRVTSVRFGSEWQIGGDAADTTILLPLQLRATRQHFVVFDAIALRVVGLAPRTGRVTWHFGRPGRGPNEFGGPSRLNARAGGGSYVIDPTNMRMTIVSEDGTAGERVDYKLGANPRGTCDAGRARVHLRATESREVERVRSTNSEVSSEDLPWPELKALPSLVRQAKLFEHPDASVCLVAVTYGPMFALLDESGVRARSTWIEDVPMGQAQSRGKGSWEMLPSVKSIEGATGVGRSFAVLFRGRSPKRGRYVDFYSVTDASYLFSIELPVAATNIAFGHGLLALAGETEEGAPYVRAYSVTPSLEGMVAKAMATSGRTAQ